ncbi:MAG: cadherin domain-containing protein, partial [Cyclobacteriaceae bacterium]
MKRLILLPLLCLGLTTSSLAQWVDWQKVVASDRFENDQFGFSAAISGDYAIVGAYYENATFVDSFTPGYGAAYILKKGADGTWQEIKKLVASDRSAGDLFGISVAISGDYAIVGASGVDKSSIETASGAAYIFYKDQGGTNNWGEVKKIAPDETNKSDLFGISVSISQNHVLIGAKGDEKSEPDDDLEGSGSAYFFSKDFGGPDNWGLVKKVVSGSRTLEGNFGNSVTIYGNYAAVGAYQEHKDAQGLNNLDQSGSVYVYQNIGVGESDWQLIQKLEASDRQEDDHFGHALAMSDDYLVVGAPDRNNSTGAAYVFTKTGDQAWDELQQLTAFDYNGGDQFGYSVAIANDYLVIGAYGQDKVPTAGNWISSAGAAYLYQKDANNWGILQKLVANDAAMNDFFGWSVAVSDSYAFVGARAEDEDNEGGNFYNSAGSAYIYSVCQNFPCFMSTAFTSFKENGQGTVLDVNAINETDGTMDADINYSISGNDASHFSIEPASGLLTFISTPDYENPTDIDSNNYYEVTVTASSNKGNTNQILIVQVTDKNENPIFVSEGTAVFEENQLTVVLDVDAMDGEDGSIDVNISYAISGEDAHNFSIDQTTGEITFLSPPDYENPIDFNQDNDYVLIVTAENLAGLKSEQMVIVSVTDIDDTPVIVVSATLNPFSTSSCSSSPPQDIKVSGDHLKGNVVAESPDSFELSLDDLSYSNSIEIVPSDGVVEETTVYVRASINATEGLINENIALHSEGAVSQLIPLDGNIDPVLTTGWQQASKIVASDREAEDWFGRFSVGISEGYAIVGVDNKDGTEDNSLDDSGAAYLFKKDDQGQWFPVKKLIADDRASDDNFGYSVAVSDNYAVVGAWQKHYDYGGPDQVTFAGAVYVFEKNQGGPDNWGQVQKLLASDRSVSEWFGNTVAIAGNEIMVGAISEGSVGLRQSGAVYVFRNDIDPGTWTEFQKLKASDQEARDLFGNSIAISGQYAVIGAWNEYNDTVDDKAGAAYVFQKDGNGNWLEVKKIVAPVRAANDLFGYSVAIREDLVAVGAYNEDEDSLEGNMITDAGSVYVYQKNNGGTDNWGLVEKIVAIDRNEGAGFGRSLALTAQGMLVGSTNSEGGLVHVFEQDNTGNWEETDSFFSNDRSAGDFFGLKMKASDDFVLIAAPFESEDELGQNTMNNAGSAYIFQKVFNHSPEFLSSDQVEFPENSEETVLDVEANDGEGGLSDQLIAYSLSGEDAIHFDIDINSGLLTFKSAPDFENPMDEDANNDYNLVISASDCDKISHQSISVLVTNSNDDPAITLSGTLNNFHSIEGQVSVAQSFTVTGRDLEGTLDISCSSFLEVSLDNTSYSKALSIETSGLAFEKEIFVRVSVDAPLGELAGNVNVHSLGVNEQMLDIDAVVDSENTAPSISKAIEDFLISEGFTNLEVDLSGTFSDADGDALDLEVQLGHVDVIGASLSQNTLMLTEKSIGTTTITVTASDGKGGLATETFEVVVNGIPIVAKPIDDQLVNEGFTSLELDLSGTFSDADGDALDLEVQLGHVDVI